MHSLGTRFGSVGRRRELGGRERRRERRRGRERRRERKREGERGGERRGRSVEGRMI